MSRRKQAKPQQLRSDEDLSLLELLPEHGECIAIPLLCGALLNKIILYIILYN